MFSCLIYVINPLKGSKFGMKSKNTCLSKTYQALTALQNSLTSLESEWETKEISLKKRFADKESLLLQKQKELDNIKKSSAHAISSMEVIINKINNVLEKNGSDNNNY